MKLQKLQKSKIFISLLVAVILVFSINQSKPKAFVPLAWAGYILAGLAAETMVEMGVKAVSKNVLKKKADDYAAEALKNGKFDFMGTNPYRNKDGSITLSPSANDRAKMAGLISGALIGTGLSSTYPQSCPEGTLDTPINGGVYGDKSDYFRLDTEMVAGGLNYGIYNRLTGVYIRPMTTTPTSWAVGAFTKTNIVPAGEYEAGKIKITTSFIRADGTSVVFGTQYQPNFTESLTQSRMLAQQNSAEIRDCNGIYVPSTNDRVYQPPMDLRPDYKMPNHDLLVNIPLKIYNVLPASQKEGPIPWSEIEEYYSVSGKDFNAVMGSNIDTYIARGDALTTVYTIGEINNIYTDIGQPKTKEEVEDEIGKLPPIQPPAIPGDNLPVPINPVEPINRGMLQVMTESYQFLADGIENSIQSMKTVTDKSMGLINYLDTAFRWLPAEWRAMFGAAFVLGVFAHFFRR